MKDSLPTLAIATVVFGAIAYFAKDDIAQQFETSRQLRMQSQQLSVLSAKADLQRLDLEERIKRRQSFQPLERKDRHYGNLEAVSRYRQNCRSPIAEDGTGITIREGIRLIDPKTGYPLQEGTPVCDSSGNTGIVQRGGIVGQFARLTDSPKRVLDEYTYNRYFKPVPASTLRRRQAL